MKSTRILLAFLAVAATLAADPIDQSAADIDTTRGFRWGELGPSTQAIDLGAYAAVRYVSRAAPAGPADGSRQRPWPDLRTALENAPAGKRTAVLVAAGTYETTALALRSGVDLFGGHDPADWSREIFRHPTLLRGTGADRILVGGDDCALDGFVIEQGVSRGHGGAILCDGTSPRITNNVFRNNRTAEPPDHPHGLKRRRVRGWDGGAIALLNGASAEIRNNVFFANETGIGYGGAINAAHDCLPAIVSNVFWGNRAGVADRNVTRSGNGGAVGLIFSSHAALVHNLFVANGTLGKGDGGAVFMEYFCWPEVARNAFLGNRAEDDGGGIDHQKLSYPKIRANLFYGNRAGKSGGGVHSDDSSAELENNLFAYNRAAKQGGGVGGTHSWARLLNNTLVFNEATQNGGAIHFVNVKNPFFRPPVLRNNLMALNNPGQVHFDSDAETAYNIMHPGGYKEGYYNRDAPPGFVDDGRSLTAGAAHHDERAFVTTIAVAETLVPESLAGRVVRVGDHWSLVRSNTDRAVEIWGPPPPAGAVEVLPTLHLAADSRAISAGTHPEFPLFDIDGDLRQFPAIDVGADAFRGTPAPR
jgi:hypothetical protein